MKIYAVKSTDLSEEKIDKLCLMLSSEERDRIKKFIAQKDKIRTLAGRILLRTVIMQEFGIPNEHLSFGQNQYGKPYLPGYPGCHFNISHSGDFVLCAISVEPLGIDIEEIKFLEYENIAKSFFAASEFNYIMNHPADLRLSKFYEIWTLKESYIKCRGQGLAARLKAFSIEIDQDENVAVITGNEHTRKYVFKRFEIGSGYKMAVCSVDPKQEISGALTIMDQKSLVNNFLNLIGVGGARP